MRKLKLLLLTLMLLVTTISLSSCNKTVLYQVAGYYIELVEVDEYKIDDRNPKIYFKYDQNDMFSQYQGALTTFDFTTKLVKTENEVKKYYFATDVLVPAGKYDTIEIHLIYLRDGKYIIDSEVHKTIKGTGTCRYSAEYTFKGEKQRLDFEINIKNK